MNIVRVLIVDDSGFIRRRVADLFADQDDMPKAIIDANLADRVLNMGALADRLASL